MPSLLINAGAGCGKSHTIAAAGHYMKATNPRMWLEREKHIGMTEQQEAIYEWVRQNFDHNGRTCYLAFNRTVDKELHKKIHPDFEHKTIHGWGLHVVTKHCAYLGPPNKKRAITLIEQITGRQFRTLDTEQWYSTIAYVTKLKEQLMECSDASFEELHYKYSELGTQRLHPNLREQASALIKAMKVVDRKVGIEFIDQIWLALFYLDGPVFENGFVDECQDLSPLMLRFCRLFCKNLVYVGDENQSINAFMGADPDAVDNIRKTVTAELPLTRTFRLPDNFVRKANNHTPRGNLVGVGREGGDEIDIDKASFASQLSASSLVICRYNAPLFRCAIYLAKQGIKCRMVGDSLIDSLVKLVENRGAKTNEELLRSLDYIEEKMLNGATERGKEATRDKFDCIRAIAAATQYPEEVIEELKALLKPKGDCPILCTIHKAKGMEADDVFILNPPVQSALANTDRERLQEHNTEYVAITRSRKRIFWVHDRCKAQHSTSSTLQTQSVGGESNHSKILT